MRHFVNKAIESLPKLNEGQIKNLIDVLAEEVKDIELLENVISSLPYGVIVAKSDHFIQFINRPVRRMLPLQQSGFEKLKVWEAILDKDISKFVQDSLLDFDSVKPRDFTLETLNRDITLAVGVMPVVNEGRIQGDFIYVEDVTDKRLEEARHRRAESLASMTTMAASVAHEIKNPLGSISIHLQLMQKTLKTDCVEYKTDLEEYLSIISEEVERLNSIVVDYLFAVRPMDTHQAPMNINSLIQELVTFVQYELQEAGIELKEMPAQNLPLLNLDENLMKQAFLNIIKNALAAMPDGGSLHISTQLKDNFVNIRIKDSGIGIPREMTSKIFEPYFTTKDNGSGLGLTMVYKVIKEHGGEIRVMSKEGEGTTFIILLPVPQTDKKLLVWDGE
ncbi:MULTISPECIES: nitrogen regulation protein NR(II) [unclassified Oceanispirochaeta]|uniref:two-component system sensor histidine kinase NtrB n=1 Tax=unclassified Oceanispirochaeta TaxID=2635722 RepID=UPI000E08E694|nr:MULTISPECIES: ATP-binding protein [unclassified Oceanispirochaeta]MBF9017683.1 PAS domain-containing sensor histidine kinase [Oceanispirochaeta sp. M2]NPD74255.1 PAS domain-containing sensor histidine kinase [Oceanispirochaeta sp. M1]RDG29961.1 PAS domain-containing sensor histidine kinase [Oceanispirochaeta sp. M1]